MSPFRAHPARLAAGALLASALAGSAAAQCSSSKLTAGDGTELDHYGNSVALDGSALLIGAVGRRIGANGDNTGAVYAYSKVNGVWVQQAMLQSDSPFAADRFGHAVTLGFPYAAVGEPKDGNDVGRVHFYKNINGIWTHTAGIIPPSSVNGDFVGEQLSMNDAGDICIVGVPRHNYSNGNTFIGLVGKAYFYARDASGTWNLEVTLEKPLAQRELNDRIGAGVACASNNVAVGVPGDDTADGLHSPGSVRMSRRASAFSWLDEGTIRPPAADNSTCEWFGEAVALYANTLAVGAPLTDVDGVTDAGAVYVYRSTPGGWILEDKLVPTDKGSNQHFGSRVAVTFDRMIVGDDRSPGGHAYIFHRNADGTWAQEAVHASDEAGTFYPNGLDIDGTTAVAGDDEETVNGHTWQGAVYVYPLQSVTGSDTCAAAAALTPGVSVAGCTASCTTEGEPGCFNFPTGPDMWFALEPTCGASYTIEVTGAPGFDTVLSVLPSCGGAPVACDDDSGPGTNSRIDTALEGGGRYLLRVAGYNGDSGAFSILVTPRAPANDQCSTAAPLTAGVPATGCTEFATVEAQTNPCGPNPGNPGPDVSFYYVAPCSGTVSVTTAGSAFDTILSVHTGCPGEFLAMTIACDDDSGPGTTSALTFQANAGSEYQIRLGGYNGAWGDYSITLTNDCPPPVECACDWNQADGLDSQDYFDFLNDFFAGQGDYNGVDGTDSQDYFDFLECFFSGCD